MIEPIDQDTKDLIKKEAQTAADFEYDLDYPDEIHYVKGYIRGATVWAEKLKQVIEPREQLAKERELRKELVESLIYISKTLGTIKSSQDEPEALAYYEAERAIKKGT